ncbi:hypothetical protein JV35_08110 [Pectobacterium betavasculorum]|uniref:Uncharacterized protein n=1 Tax=Pectobacterium betavasculorum TaxID=55207 RepID=A0ABR4V385_9GAMM|nr:hypothetical protein JV35_08110 [Pectobacterium betavasculorum]
MIDNVHNALTSGFIATVVNALYFQAAEEPLRNSIIQTVTVAAHTAHHIKFLLAGMELGAGIQSTLIATEYGWAFCPSFFNRQS